MKSVKHFENALQHHEGAQNYHPARLGQFLLEKPFFRADLVLHTVSLKSMCPLTQEFMSIFSTEMFDCYKSNDLGKK